MVWIISALQQSSNISWTPVHLQKWWFPRTMKMGCLEFKHIQAPQRSAWHVLSSCLSSSATLRTIFAPLWYIHIVGNDDYWIGTDSVWKYCMCFTCMFWPDLICWDCLFFFFFFFFFNERTFLGLKWSQESCIWLSAGKGTWSGYGARPRGKGIVDQCCRPAGCELQHLEMYCAKPKSQQHTTAHPLTTTGSDTTTQLEMVWTLLLKYESLFITYSIWNKTKSRPQ